MNEPAQEMPVLKTRVNAPAQLLLCRGCCCGKTERGLPEVPVDRIKAIWKAEKLNRRVQLTISGCLGPCDLPNVAVVVTASRTEWLGLLDSDRHYDLLIAWARSCMTEGRALPLPPELDANRFDRFAEATETADSNRG